MMNEFEKSDSVVVAAKPTNKAEQSAAEPVEPRTGTKGNVGQQSTRPSVPMMMRQTPAGSLPLGA